MKSPLTVTFLGTGTSQGIPIIGSDHPVCKSDDIRDKRLRVSVMLEWDEHRYVIDCGPDFRQQMLREEVDRLDGILLTHEHSDHTAGLDDIRPFYFRQGIIDFYGQERVFAALRQRFAYIFDTEDKYPGTPEINQISINKDESFYIGGRQIIPIEAFHGALPVLGFRIGDFAYLTDIKTISAEERAKLKGLKVLVLNALREAPHYSHLNLEEALALASELAPQQTYFTHISHKLGFHQEVEARLPASVRLAYDTLKIQI